MAPLYSKEWISLSRLMLRTYPLCQDCRHHKSEQVHHLDPRAESGHLIVPMSELLALCTSCHAKRTNQEMKVSWANSAIPGRVS